MILHVFVLAHTLYYYYPAAANRLAKKKSWPSNWMRARGTGGGRCSICPYLRQFAGEISPGSLRTLAQAWACAAETARTTWCCRHVRILDRRSPESARVWLPRSGNKSLFLFGFLNKCSRQTLVMQCTARARLAINVGIEHSSRARFGRCKIWSKRADWNAKSMRNKA